jgi:hypothetical protein
MPLWAALAGDGEAAGLAVASDGSSMVAGSVGGWVKVWRLDAFGGLKGSGAVVRGLAGAAAGLPTGGLVIAGTDFAGEDPDPLLAVTDRAGALVWAKVLDLPGDDFGRGVAATPSGLYLAGQAGRDALVASYDLAGNLRWTKLLGSPLVEERLEAAAPTRDGGVVVAGWTYDGARNNVLVARLDSDRELLWLRILSSSDARVNLRGHAVAVAPDGSVLVAGARDIGGGSLVPLLLLYSDEGDLLWLRLLEVGGGSVHGIAADPLGGALLVGNALKPDLERDWMLARVTPGGSVAWSLRGSPGQDGARAVAWLPTGFVAAGSAGEGVRVAAYLDGPARPLAT